MSDYDGTIVFKDWLPDQPDLNNPGLTLAQNCVPFSGKYASFAPLFNLAGGTAPAIPSGAFAVMNPDLGHIDTYIGTGTQLLRHSSTVGSFTNLSAATYGAGSWIFTSYGNMVLAVDGSKSVTPQAHTIGSASAFTALSASAPTAGAIGRIGQFVIVGNLSVTVNKIQWCGINNITSWPTPNSSTAIAQQAGSQVLVDDTPVTGISNGDQFGIVFQREAMTRVTYIGGNVVFQFDAIHSGRGTKYPKSIVRVGALTYFADADGFWVTDGVSVSSIDYGSVRDYVAALSISSIFGAHDQNRNLIYWSTGNNIFIYNYVDKRWTITTQVASLILTVPYQLIAASKASIYGFGSTTMGSFSGTPGTAIITTAEIEPNPGGFSRIQGIKPLVDVTANAVTVAIGTRNDQSSSVTYTSETTANSRSGFCNFRSEARYHRARVSISGTFNAAQGLEYEAVPSGYL